MSGKGKEEWVKNLYTKTGLADNFTPGDCFLAAIQRNKNVRGHTFSECLEAACQVNMQLCAVLIFAVAYVFLVRNYEYCVHHFNRSKKCAPASSLQPATATLN